MDKELNIMELILKYFPNLSDKQKEQFAALYPLYTDWNSKINVISRKDIENLYPHHVTTTRNTVPRTAMVELGVFTS